MKSKYTLKPIFSLDISIAYNFSVIPQKDFVAVLANEIPNCANNGFAQAIDVRNNILASIYKKSDIESETADILHKLEVDTENGPIQTTGIIYSYVPSNFGFIEVSDGGPNAFFFHNHVDIDYRKQLKIGDKVTFLLKRSTKGRQASSISKLPETEES